MKKSICFLGLCGLSLVGCASAPQQPTYYWEDYSHTLYQLKKEPTQQHLLEHKEMLLQIIEASKENDARVPPGICCELGSILAAEGKKKEAVYYYDQEMKTYPESSVLVGRLKSAMGRK